MEQKSDLITRLNGIESVIQTSYFREKKGLGNDVGYFIFDYPSEMELVVREQLERVVRRINESHLGFEVKMVNLYEVILQTLTDEGYLDKCFEMEEKKGFDFLSGAIIKLLKMSQPDGPIVTHIINLVSDSSIVFLTGVGSCYPILRAHNILNSMLQVLDTVPVVVFYPGKYSGQDLQLFGTMKDDNFYRAFPFPVSVGKQWSEV